MSGLAAAALLAASSSAWAQTGGASAAAPAAAGSAPPGSTVVVGMPALKAAASIPGAVVTPSGLVFRSLKEGEGANPGPNDVVRVHYRGSFMNGKEFDSSYSRGQPTTFPLNRVIKCWTEGLQRMKAGGHAHLTCPSELAYGERSVGGGLIPPSSILQFEVQLLSFTPGSTVPPAPPAPTAQPASAGK